MGKAEGLGPDHIPGTKLGEGRQIGVLKFGLKFGLRRMLSGEGRTSKGFLEFHLSWPQAAAGREGSLGVSRATLPWGSCYCSGKSPTSQDWIQWRGVRCGRD